MASEIWKIGQEHNADKVFNEIKDKGVPGCFLLRGEVVAVSTLTKICAEMINAYNDVIEDQNSYLLEIDDMVQKLDDINDDIQAKISKLMNEIEELKEKEQNGTITDEEKGQLDTKQNELNVLLKKAEKNPEEEREKIKSKNEKRQESYRSKEKVAMDYGETTVEKGTPLALTEVKGGFFRKLFGTTGKHKKEVGEKAVQTGNELLDKVTDTIDVDNDIDKKLNSKNIK